MSDDPEETIFEHRRFHEGLEHFNGRRFWEAHESWEEIWLTATGASRVFLQGLIQIAAAYHLASRVRYRGASRLFAAGAAKLSSSAEVGTGVIDVPEILSHARGDQMRIEQRTVADELVALDPPRLSLREFTGAEKRKSSDPAIDEILE